MAANAGLYQLPDSVIVFKDDRATRRHSVRATVFVAPYHNGEVQPFEAAVARDISTGGMSFYMRFEPVTKLVVVDLSRKNFPLVVLCRVVRCEAATDTVGPAFVLGCQFLEVWQSPTIMC